MNETIMQFMQEQTCATICCNDEAGNPYCFNCYFALNKEDGLLYFKSSSDTNHVIMLGKNPIIAGTILPDKLNILITRGVQFQGDLLQHADPLAKDGYLRYHKKYAMALAMKGEVFTIRINSIKMTDSNLGFGRKIEWTREALCTAD
ncbi:MAG: hypothetical protein JWP81_3388 [Ferruginibacter sp.]|nr:hypothetical protein [Ferruginibacter sp.]